MEEEMNPGATCEGLRVLLVGPYPPPYGGIASHLTTLIPGLVERRAADITVVSFDAKSTRERREGFLLYRVNVKHEWRLFLTLRHLRVFLYSVWTLAGYGLGPRAIVGTALKALVVDDIASQHDSNVVSFYQSDSHLEALPLQRIWAERRATIVTVFGEVYSSESFVRSHPALFQALLAAPKHVLSSSKHCADSFRLIGVPRAIEAVYYGVDLNNAGAEERRVIFRQAHRIREDDVCVLFMGRFHVDMGLDVLLEAAPLVLDANARVRLVIAGAKGDLSVAARHFAAAHPERVLLLEDVPFSQQPSLYAAADILVAPSYNQRACMGMSIKEAMAASLPVVAGAGGGVPEAVVEGETGFLVGLGPTGAVDVQIFAERILLLAGDPAMRARFASAGRHRAETLFSFELSNQRLAAIFMSARPR